MKYPEGRSILTTLQFDLLEMADALTAFEHAGHSSLSCGTPLLKMLCLWFGVNTEKRNRLHDRSGTQ